MTPPVGQRQSFGAGAAFAVVSPALMEAAVATITDRLGPFTGQVGPVVFRNGSGESDDPDVLAYFHADPDRYDVSDDYDELAALDDLADTFPDDTLED